MSCALHLPVTSVTLRFLTVMSPAVLWNACPLGLVGRSLVTRLSGVFSARVSRHGTPFSLHPLGGE